MKTFKIKANKEQLNSFGHKQDLTGLVGVLTQSFPTGWYELEVNYVENGVTRTGRFDFPKSFLKEVKSKK